MTGARLSALFLFLLVLLFIVEAKDKKEIWRRKRLDEKLHLLKGIENTIDHGPEHRRKQQHGRHHHHHHMHQQHVDSGQKWRDHHGRQRHDRDDVRLQHVDFQVKMTSGKPKKKQQQAKTKVDAILSKPPSVIRDEVRRAAKQGLDPEKIYAKFSSVKETNLAKKYYKKWLAKYKVKKASAKNNNVP